MFLNGAARQTEELLREAICRDLVLPVEMHSFVSTEVPPRSHYLLLLFSVCLCLPLYVSLSNSLSFPQLFISLTPARLLRADLGVLPLRGIFWGFKQGRLSTGTYQILMSLH